MKINLAHEVDAGEWDQLAMKLGGGFHHCHAAILADAFNEKAKPLFIKALDARNECVGIGACTIAQSRIWPSSCSAPWRSIVGTGVHFYVVRAHHTHVAERGVGHKEVTL